MRSTESLLKPFNTGIVVGDMTPLSNKIRVFPMENQRGVHGDVTRVNELTNIEYTNELEDPVAQSITMSYTLEATWLALNNHNRLTAPMMRNGEKVQLYRFGDSEEVLWVPYDLDHDLRTTEYMIMGCSNKADREKAVELKNCYYAGMDSLHKTFTIFHIPDNNGEYTSYDFKVDSKTGNLLMEDGKGNKLLLDSTEDAWTLQSNTTINVLTETVNIEATTINMDADDINMTSKTLNIDSKNISIKGTTSHTGAISTTDSIAVGKTVTTGIPISTAHTAAKT